MADAYVVDTAIFVRRFIDQPGYEHATVKKQFLDGGTHLETVDFARIELAEVLRKKGLLDRRLDIEEFKAAARVIDDLGIVVQQSDAERVERATDLAARWSLRMLDALFVQVALDRELPLLTADQRLCRAVSTVISTELLRGIEPRA